MKKIDRLNDEERRELPMIKPSLRVQPPAYKPVKLTFPSYENKKMEADTVLISTLRTRKPIRGFDRHSRDLILKLIQWFEDNP